MKKAWLEWGKAFVIAAVLAIIVRMVLFAPVVVEGPSMLPTLKDSDHMIVSKINYTIGNPERFDIIVFHATEKKDYVKRVIGLPGDTVAVKDDQLYINGKKVEEPYLEERKESMPDGQKLTQDFTLEGVTGQKTVPEGHVFVLGDNRNNSTDSRILGFIPYEAIVGEAVLIYWPIDRIRIVE
ncbi:signal peptidase I [Thalassobacillus pellis]|nr:signal peptidase I [Thalassobacillus pellis]MBM7552770.1 signal peptidase I [Thalassobacillus pellis]